MDVEFCSDLIKNIQPLQAKMTSTLYQEQTLLRFKYQAQLDTVRTPQRGRPEHILKTEGRERSAWNKSCNVQLRVCFSLHFNGPKSCNKITSQNYCSVTVNRDYSYDFSKQSSNQSFISGPESYIWYLFEFLGRKKLWLMSINTVPFSQGCTI